MIRLTPDPTVNHALTGCPICAEPPIARAAMDDANAICTRMAEDLNDLRREAGGVSEAHLIDLGWSARQITTHLLEAIDRASKGWRLAACNEAIGDGNLAASSEAAPDAKEPAPCA